MAIEITALKLRNRKNLEDSRFIELYRKLVLSNELNDSEYQELLAFAVIFLQQEDETVQKLGYRIALQYSIDTLDFDPLVSIADHREIMPILAAIREAHPGAINYNRLKNIISFAHEANFTRNGTTWTREQLALQEFNKHHLEAAIIAPTSYGKSEMLITRALSNLVAATCIIVPSKALVSQTKKDLIRELSSSEQPIRVITHPEAYNGEWSFIAVLTQERLHRLFTDNPSLRFDHLLIDEAQNILSDDFRSLELSQVILIARRRNPELRIAYYTPFLEDPTALQHLHGADSGVRSRSVSEQVKAERFFAGELGAPLHAFDQYLIRSFESDWSVPNEPAEMINALAGKRTIVYLNRPRDAQAVALQLAERIGEIPLSQLAETAITAISDLLDEDYALIDAIRSGVLFHHGQIPEVLRQYVENLFREDQTEQRRFLVTTSTLLEGVNTPADTMILMSPGKGRGYLSRSAFRNLVGRVARFSQIFRPDMPQLSLLLPKIYAIKSSYTRRDWNPIRWLTDRSDPNKIASEQVENPLLESGPPDQPRIEALERLENIEPGSSGLENLRLAETRVGELCFKHGVREFDVFRHERLLEQRLNERGSILVTTPRGLIALICHVFLEGVELVGKDADNFKRLREEAAAQRFYSMFLGWRVESLPMKFMIKRYLQYWNEQTSDWIWVGSKWGDEKKLSTEHVEAYVRRSKKTRPALLNLAIVRIKAELDFLDYALMKYLEILYSMHLVEESLYLSLKYGTDDRFIIALLRNGMSFELARLIAESYRDYVSVDLTLNTVEIGDGLLEVMATDSVNDILLFEMRGLQGING